MGGSSRSSQSTANNQSTTNLVNDGEYAGASDISIDESDRSVNDSNNTNTELNFDQNIDRSVDFESDSSVNDSNNTDVNQEYDYSSEISNEYDNSVENNQDYDYSGEYSGNTGTINITDGGAIDANKEVSKAAIDEISKQSESSQKLIANSLDSALKNSLEFGGDTVDSAFDFGTDALSSVNDSTSKAFDFGTDALSSVNDISSAAIDANKDVSKAAIDEFSEYGTAAVDTVSENLSEQSERFSDSLSKLSSSSNQLNQKILADAAAASSQDKSVIADLAKSTSLAGQDLVAKSSERMVLYIAIAIGVVGVSLAIASGVKK